MNKIRSLFITFALLAAFLAACLPSGNAPDGRKTIVATYSVLGSIVSELVGNQATVIVTIPKGQDPHDWEPSARDIENINKADLVIENGLGLESGVENTLNRARERGVKFFTASDYITVRHVGEGEGIPTGDPDQVIGAPDPHLWTDPLTMKSVVVALALELNALGLDVNNHASELEGKLESLNQELSEILADIPPENRKLVTGHESMGYFALRYGFKLVGVIIPSLTSQAGVSAADLAVLKQAIEENQVKAIFTELGTSAAVAKAIGEATGVKVIELNTHTLPGDGSYFTFMKDMANVINNGLK